MHPCIHAYVHASFSKRLVHMRARTHASVHDISRRIWMLWPVVCLNVNIHTHTHAYTHLQDARGSHQHAYMHPHTHAYMHKHTHTHTHTHICIHVSTHACIHAQNTRTCTHTFAGMVTTRKRFRLFRTVILIIIEDRQTAFNGF